MKRKILIANDSEEDRQTLYTILIDEYDIIEAENIGEALQMLYQMYNDISAILLEINIVEHDEFEVLKEICNNRSLLQIPIIAITQSSDRETEIKMLKQGATDFITRPFYTDIVKQRLKNVIQLRENAAHIRALKSDELTGIYNRKSFFEKAEKQILEQEAGYYVLVSLDIDKFKVINDQYGTIQGDETLKYIAKVIYEGMSSIGGICARFSADDFALLYPAKENDTLVLHTLLDKIKLYGKKFSNLSISVGKYVVDDLAIPISSMYDRALLALYSIKGDYVKRIATYDETMRTKLLHEQEIINEMQSALHSGEFEPWFQPQYNHTTGAIIGAEALVRWRHPQKGLIAPYLFVPIFERNGFIYEMDKYIWEQCCITLRRWIDEGKNPLPISVNVSRYDALRADFFETIISIVRNYNIPAELFCIEITESAFTESSDQLIQVTKKLIDYGFIIEIDDFGSGYSSLNTLKDVPAQVLKLDMRFFTKTDNADRSGNIVASIIRMAKWIGMSVIAEGVEDKEQADYLKTIGCYYIQGYYYSKPISIEEYEKLFTTSKKEPQMSKLQTLETFNNNEFWNPKSMETLIFNSYVGGACIFEYQNGTTELLRINDRYSTEFGSLAIGNADLNNAKTIPFIGKENKRKIIENIENAIESKKESTCELMLSGIIDRKNHIEYVRTTVRVLAKTEERYLLYAVVLNTTATHLAEQKRVEAERSQLESAIKLEVIMKNINGGVSAIKIEDDGSSRLVFNNDRYFALYGYTKEQAIEENIDIMTLILPEDYPNVMEKVRKLKEDRVPTVIDYKIVKKGGKTANLRANASIMYMDGYGEVITSVISDVTEIISLQDQLNAIIESINGGVTATIIKDGEPKFVVVNDQFFNMLGYKTREEYDRELPNKYTGVHPEDRERIIKQFETSDGGKDKFTMNYRVIRKDGQIRYIKNNISIVHLFGVDEPVKLSVANDVTEEYIANEKERAVTEQMQAILSNIENGIIATIYYSMDSIKVLFSSNGFYSMLGYTKEEFEKDGIRVRNLIHENDYELVENAIKEVLENRKSITYEFRCYKKNGDMIWIQCTNTAISLRGIKETVVIAVTVDITQAKIVEEQLRFLNASSYSILAQPDSDKAINETLKRVVDYFGADRGYVIEIDNQSMITNNTYEICVDGITKEIDKLQGIPFAKSVFWYKALKDNKYYILNNIEDMGEDEEYKQMLKEQNIHSIILAALYSNQQIIGFVGVDNPTKAINQIGQMTAIADNIAVLLIRRDTKKREEENQKIMERMVPLIFNGIMKHSTDISFAKDKDLHYLYCSRTYANVLELEDENEIAGKTDYDLFDKETADRFRKSDMQLVSTKEPVIDEMDVIKSKNGMPYYTRTSKYVIYDANNNIIAIYGIGRDITKYQEADDRLKLLQRSIPGGLVTLVYNGTTTTIEYGNDRFYEWLGYTKKELQTIEDLMELVFVDDVSVINDFRRQLINNDEQVIEGKFRCKNKDGKVMWVSIKAAVTDKIKDIMVVNAVFIDITELRKG